MLTSLSINGKVNKSGVAGAPAISLFVKPTEQEKRHLIDDLFIDEHTLSSALDPNELGRIEFEENHVDVILKIVKADLPNGGPLQKPISLGLFLFADNLVIVSNEEFVFDKKILSVSKSAHDVFLRIMFQSILHFETHLKAMRGIYEQLQSKINKAFSNENLIRMLSLEENLMYYIDAIDSNSKIMEIAKMNSSKLKFTSEVHELLEDLIIENAQCLRQAEFFAEVLSNLMDAWASIINNNLNTRIKTLTIVSIALMVPTLIVSIFSMNVPLPFSPQGFMSFWYIVIMALAAMTAVLLTSFYKKI